MILLDCCSTCANVNTELSAQEIAIHEEIAVDPDPSELPEYDYEDKNDCRILISILNNKNYNISPEDREVLESIINSPMINTAVIYTAAQYMLGIFTHVTVAL